MPISCSRKYGASNVSTQIDSIPKLMTRKETARHLKAVYGISMSPMTLDTLASQGGGPRYAKFGRRVYYDAMDIEDWVRKRISRKFSSTSDEQYGAL